MWMFKASSAAQAWIPVVAMSLVCSGILAAIAINRIYDHPVRCSHRSLPLITDVTENDAERIVALSTALLAMPFNTAFAVGAWAVWRKLDGEAAGGRCIGRAGPCACALAGWILVALFALNDRGLDPHYLLHFALFGSWGLCDLTFLACSLWSLERAMTSSSFPKHVLVLHSGVLELRRAVSAAKVLALTAFVSISITSSMTRNCEEARRLMLYGAVAEYALLLCGMVQYLQHAYEFRLLHTSGIWASAARDDQDGLASIRVVCLCLRV
uniref:Uncharacterized protein n=1 Tax=Alexandrium catenella TaxID=2925 RepID=A0A7S1RFW4_ALECA|mmetsp:Transcript_55973/g.149806  ORF Transcript_55973/g.149806 Transcript_55973/m.149806 type:complete len:269 (+) Transcript_55973:115-921(+)|eukprot:CAMPEP_0171157734 /NCGR_PEP_ID=MMETSP0790-20130122/2124_1 /TAXON_ID=2925 /ORGANISM="Alexandrium catenella, Strain OF101" /LENGTH=268 /DNA_ID=CAMNT_0011622105 /DNA_START=113 /DNA_END=919 /DNA_ORIENTATION=-